MASLTGTLRYDATTTKLAFYAMSEAYLIDNDDLLSDAEIVVYATILIKGWRKGQRSVYTQGVSKLSAYTNIERHTVDTALGGLVERHLLKKTADGYASVGPKFKRNYLMISSAILMSKILKVKQKALILRLAAIKSHSDKDVIITYSEIAHRTDGDPSTVRGTLKLLSETEWEVLWKNTYDIFVSFEDTQWIYKEADELVIDFGILHELVYKELGEELANYRATDIQNKHTLGKDPDSGWLAISGKITDKKRDLINRIDKLRLNGNISLSKAKVLVKYLGESRLSYVKSYVLKAEGEK